MKNLWNQHRPLIFNFLFFIWAVALTVWFEAATVIRLLSLTFVGIIWLISIYVKRPDYLTTVALFLSWHQLYALSWRYSIATGWQILILAALLTIAWIILFGKRFLFLAALCLILSSELVVVMNYLNWDYRWQALIAIIPFALISHTDYFGPISYFQSRANNQGKHLPDALEQVRITS